MVGDEGVLVADRLHPVGALPRTRLYLVPIGHERGEVVRSQPVHIALLVHDHGILLSVEQVGHLIDVLPAGVTVVGYLRLSLMALLGRDENDTVGGARTVDGGRSSILEHVHALNVGRVEIVKVALHAVDEHERLRAARGAYTSYIYFITAARHTRRLRELHARRTALQGGKRIDSAKLGYLVALHLHGSTGDKLFLLHAIANDHHIVERMGIVLQRDRQGLTADTHILRLRSYITDVQHSTLRRVNGEVAIDVGHCSLFCRLILHSGSDDGLTLAVDHSTLYSTGILGTDSERQAQRGSHQSQSAQR